MSKEQDESIFSLLADYGDDSDETPDENESNNFEKKGRLNGEINLQVNRSTYATSSSPSMDSKDRSGLQGESKKKLSLEDHIGPDQNWSGSGSSLTSSYKVNDPFSSSYPRESKDEARNCSFFDEEERRRRPSMTVNRSLGETADNTLDPGTDRRRRQASLGASQDDPYRDGDRRRKDASGCRDRARDEEREGRREGYSHASAGRQSHMRGEAQGRRYSGYADAESTGDWDKSKKSRDAGRDLEGRRREEKNTERVRSKSHRNPNCNFNYYSHDYCKDVRHPPSGEGHRGFPLPPEPPERNPVWNPSGHGCVPYGGAAGDLEAIQLPPPPPPMAWGGRGRAPHLGAAALRPPRASLEEKKKLLWGGKREEAVALVQQQQQQEQQKESIGARDGNLVSPVPPAGCPGQSGGDFSQKVVAAAFGANRWDQAAGALGRPGDRDAKFRRLMGVKPALAQAAEAAAAPVVGEGVMTREKQSSILRDTERQFLSGLRRADGRSVGLGL